MTSHCPECGFAFQPPDANGFCINESCINSLESWIKKVRAARKREGMTDFERFKYESAQRVKDARRKDNS